MSMTVVVPCWREAYSRQTLWPVVANADMYIPIPPPCWRPQPYAGTDMGSKRCLQEPFLVEDRAQ
jgi:hypothetical protein